MHVNGRTWKDMHQVQSSKCPRSLLVSCRSASSMPFRMASKRSRESMSACRASHSKPNWKRHNSTDFNRMYFINWGCHYRGYHVPSCAPGFAVLQKTSTQQGDPYRIGPYNTSQLWIMSGTLVDTPSCCVSWYQIPILVSQVFTPGKPFGVEQHPGYVPIFLQQTHTQFTFKSSSFIKICRPIFKCITHTHIYIYMYCYYDCIIV